MTKLSMEQVAGVVQYVTPANDPVGRNVNRLHNPDTEGPIFCAIAMAESGGETTATHTNNNGTTDYGLWQINSVHSALLKGGDWQNPSFNYQMANTLYLDAGGKFTPWTTYNTGVYAVHLPAAQKAWGKPDTSMATHSPLKDTTDAVDSAASNLANVAALISTLSKSSTWVRIGTGAAGVVLLLVVVAAMTRTHLPLPGPMGAAVKAAIGGK